MKPIELTTQEKEQTNGGNTGLSASSAIAVKTDSLISLSYTWQNGDQQTTYTMEAGKDIDISLGGKLNTDSQ